MSQAYKRPPFISPSEWFAIIEHFRLHASSIDRDGFAVTIQRKRDEADADAEHSASSSSVAGDLQVQFSEEELFASLYGTLKSDAVLYYEWSKDRQSERERSASARKLFAIAASSAPTADDLAAHYHLQINLLLFVQEFACALLERQGRASALVQLLTDIVYQPHTSGPGVHLRSQALVTITTIVIQLDMVYSAPQRAEQFIELLCQAISQVEMGEDPSKAVGVPPPASAAAGVSNTNSSSNLALAAADAAGGAGSRVLPLNQARVLRGTACECLRELEEAFPGLLCDMVGPLATLCRVERSHVAQSYTTLLATVLHHRCVYLVSPIPEQHHDGDEHDGDARRGAIDDDTAYETDAFSAASSFYKTSSSSSSSSSSSLSFAQQQQQNAAAVRRGTTASTFSSGNFASASSLRNTTSSSDLSFLLSKTESWSSINTKSNRMLALPPFSLEHSLIKSYAFTAVNSFLFVPPTVIISSADRSSASSLGSGVAPSTPLSAQQAAASSSFASSSPFGMPSTASGTFSSAVVNFSTTAAPASVSASASNSSTSSMPNFFGAGGAGASGTMSSGNLGALLGAEASRKSLEAALRSPTRPLPEHRTLAASELKEIKRYIALLVEAIPQCTMWGVLDIVLRRLVMIVQLCELPTDLFRHHFLRFMSTNVPAFFHVLLYLSIRFPVVFHREHLLLLRRMLAMLNEFALAEEEKHLVAKWLLQFPRWLGVVVPGMPPLYQFRNLLYPSIFDSLLLREAKIHALVHCFVARNPIVPSSNASLVGAGAAAADASAAEQADEQADTTTDDDEDSSSVDAEGGASGSYSPSAKRLMEVLVCLEEFKHFPSNHASTAVAFRVFALLLSRFPKTMINAMYEYLRELLLEQPEFLPNVIELIRQLQRECKLASKKLLEQQRRARSSSGSQQQQLQQQQHQQLLLLQLQQPPDLPTRLLTRFNNVLTSVAPQKLIDYLPLLREIALLPSIHPSPMIEALFTMVRVTNMCSQGDWRIGNQLLEICTVLLTHHPSKIIFQPLTTLLLFCSRHHSDIEIRDRAFFYYQLLTHVDSNSIRSIVGSPASDAAADIPPSSQQQQQQSQPASSAMPSAGLLSTTPTSSSVALIVGSPARSLESAASSMPAAPPSSSSSQNDASTSSTSAESDGSDDGSDSEAAAEAPDELLADADLSGENAGVVMRELPPFLTLLPTSRVLPTAAASSSSSSSSNTASDESRQVPSIAAAPSVATAIVSKSESMAVSASPAEMAEIEAGTAKYFAMLKSNSFQPTVQVSFVLRYLPPSRLTDAAARAGVPDSLLALSLQLAECATLAPMSVFRVPLLARPPPHASSSVDGDSASEDASALPYPFSAAVLFAFKPLAPLPASVAVRATFNDENGRQYQTQLAPKLNLRLIDLFLPVPVESLCSSDSTVMPLRRRIFEYVWKFTMDVKKCQTAGTSVKVLKAPREQVLRVLNGPLAPFVVEHSLQNDAAAPSDTTDTDTTDEATQPADELWKVFVFLPPKHHLLMMFLVSSAQTVVKLNTDYWLSLAYVDDFFGLLLDLPPPTTQPAAAAASATPPN